MGVSGPPLLIARFLQSCYQRDHPLHKSRQDSLVSDRPDHLVDLPIAPFSFEVEIRMIILGKKADN
jgi:hypothetical protein